MIDVIYDMETQDPDDLFALAILATHSQTSLRAVTITPGSRAQIGVVREALHRLGSKAKIGGFNPNHEKDCVAPYWTEFLDENRADRKPKPSDPDGLGYQIISNTLLEFPTATVITGAPLKNLGAFLTACPNQQITHWVAQGGFAGDSIVPPEYRLPKFAGLETCPTFNFNGDPKSASAMLTSPMVLKRHLVSKNVCHGIIYNEAIHAKIAKHKDHVGIDFIYQGMDRYLRKHKEGKKFHDPFACCVAIDPSIAEFREVQLYRAKGGWGSKLASGTNTFITIKADIEKFIHVMLDSSARGC